MMRIEAMAMLLLVAGCGNGGDANETAAAVENAAPTVAEAPADAAPGAETQEKVLKSETVEGVFTGWEVGDYVWANFKVAGRESAGAFVGPTPLEHFLEAHKNKPLTLKIDTVMIDIPEAGGEQEVPKIASASAGGVTAEAWWQGLSAEQKQAAERRMEDVLGGGV